jgi:hypothetical protein
MYMCVCDCVFLCLCLLCYSVANRRLFSPHIMDITVKAGAISLTQVPRATGAHKAASGTCHPLTQRPAVLLRVVAFGPLLSFCMYLLA